MILVHISDLHVGSQFQQDVFDRMQEEVNELDSDAIIITGDLTNEGLMKEYERCATLVSRLRTKKMIILSGNHDYRNTGYLLYKKHFAFEPVNELGDGVVVITVGTARPDRNEGEVGYRQNLWLEKTVSKYKNSVKIVAMHHHLIGIPDTGSDRLTIMDAGDVLRTIISTSTDLVLCGHRHRPWIWNLGNLQIVNAGTATSERLRGLFKNTYNIITIRDKKIEVDLKIVGGERMPLADVVKDYAPSEEK